MSSDLLFSVFILFVGVAGFALIGYVHVHLTDGKRFRAQPRPKKKAIVALALAQWPYMFLTFYGLAELVRKMN